VQVGGDQHSIHGDGDWQNRLDAPDPQAAGKLWPGSPHDAEERGNVAPGAAEASPWPCTAAARLPHLRPVRSVMFWFCALSRVWLLQ